MSICNGKQIRWLPYSRQESLRYLGLSLALFKIEFFSVPGDAVVAQDRRTQVREVASDSGVGKWRDGVNDGNLFGHDFEYFVVVFFALRVIERFDLLVHEEIDSSLPLGGRGFLAREP